jgi:solute carrier family 25 2-oxodicarboxylate transporter 21
VSTAPKRATKFAANEQYSQLVKKMYGRPDMTQSMSILAGVMAGCTEAFVVVSFELVKIRLQDKNNVSHLFLFSGKRLMIDG